MSPHTRTRQPLSTAPPAPPVATAPQAADEESQARDLPSRRTALGLMGGFGALAVASALFGTDLLSPSAATTDGDFAGETLKVLIPLAEGGGTDTWARFIGTELSRTIPGKPGFAPNNEAGGEGISGTNHFVSSAKADGTEILVSTATTVVPWVLGRKAVRYDFDRLVPVVANGTGAVIYARTAAGVRGVEDLLDRPKRLKFGGITATGLDVTTLLAFDLLEMDVEAVFGFEGRGPVNLALQRGEVDIDYQTTSAYGPAVEGLVKDGKAVPLMSLGQVDASGKVVRDPNFPKLPTVVEVYEKLHGKAPEGPKLESYRTLLGLTYTYQKGLWVPKDTPKAASSLLRQSADRLGKDATFQKAAAKVLGGYPLVADADLPQRVRTAYRVDDAVREHVLSLLTDTYHAKID
ncbi:tripartite tricarboxylate transporter substrate-binding protein [Phycicoccus sp. SLBN-51]|uniref:tripartite tricarboxylate transporter substrate-binding protein n=1 Tax=Phycicoccus sp. SLBN-51 TaxID=2768447 RepID=UPI0011521792|nr:tripartite tricarboxylate transporter substrate-binding protein [Phycicoccus sp. SLBN-51]TQJ52260.1 tripartite-type tricarboxylate transporter receptor subunit TctC [Phycicoccus sp. SLBN-51]